MIPILPICSHAPINKITEVTNVGFVILMRWISMLINKRIGAYRWLLVTESKYKLDLGGWMIIISLC